MRTKDLKQEIAQFESNGFSSDLKKYKRCVSILVSCVWFDCNEKGLSSSKHPFINEILTEASQSLSRNVNNLVALIEYRLSFILNGECTDSLIHEHSIFISEH